MGLGLTELNTRVGTPNPLSASPLSHKFFERFDPPEPTDKYADDHGSSYENMHAPAA